MKIRFNKDIPYLILFILCVVIPTFNNYELTFLTWLIAALITLKKKYSVAIVSLIIISLLILLFAGISTLRYQYPIYNVIRDTTYLLKPILGLLIGYQLTKSIKTYNIFKVMVYAGFVLAIIHFIAIFISSFVIRVNNLHDLRYYAGYFSDFEVYAVIILIFSSKFQLDFSPKQRTRLLIFIGLSSFIYFARTNFLQYVCLAIAMLGYFRLTKRSIIAISSLMIAGLSVYAVIYYSNPNRGAKGFEAFLYKVKIAPFEPFKTKINQNDWKEFNDNYRSFENIITLKQVAAEGTEAIILGKGLGSSIDIGREMWTNDNEFIRYVPTLHNSYMTIYLKSGLLGVMFLILFIVYLLNNKKSPIPLVQSINYLMIGTGVFLILSNWVFMGLYFKVDNKAILIGSLICYREILNKRYLLQEKVM